MRQTQINSSQDLGRSRAHDRVMVPLAGGFSSYSGNQATLPVWMTRMNESGHAASE
jgi:hypothetical protein